MNQQEILHSPFDIEVHKRVFINYLEVIIDEEGVVHYAVPSHQEFLIRRACEKLEVSRKELLEACPVEYYGDFLQWLCALTKCVAVWDRRCYGHLNRKQFLTLTELRQAGLYKGV